MLKQCLFFLASLMLLLPQPTSAARLFLDPATATITTGCPETVWVRIDHEGVDSNTTQLYLSHTLDGPGESLTISPGSAYSDYFTPPNIPAGLDALVGYTFDTITGDAAPFARLTLRSNDVGETVNVTIELDETADITSRVYNSGVNYLDTVEGGTYTVVDGYCDMVRPTITNRDPAPQEPNHPVDENILFHLEDNSSGVDIATLIVDITHVGGTITYLYDDPALSYTALNARNFAIDINPIVDFVPEEEVSVRVQVRDRAGNLLDTTYRFNQLTCEALGCTGEQLITQCNDGIDNDFDGTVDLDDSGCTDPADNNEYTPPGTHQCNDGIDNDGDGSIDLGDSGCITESDGGGGTVTEYSTSTVTTTQVVSSEVDVPDCSDGRDNDGDGAVDYPADTGCTDPNDTDEYIPTGGVSPSDLLFFLADRTIQTYADSSRTVDGLANNAFGVDLSLTNITTPIATVLLQTSFESKPMLFDNTTGRYRADVDLPATAGLSESFVRITYADGTVVSIPFQIDILPYGQVLARDDVATPLSGATVSLEWYQDGAYSLVARSTAQTDGRYAFIVPNGTYRLTTEFDTYVTDRSARFTVANNIVNATITLQPSVSLLDPEVPIEEKWDFVVGTTEEQIESIRELADDPVVEERVEQIAAPIAAAATVASLVPVLSGLGLLNYLRFLFFQPLLLLGRRKRKGWGYVYDTLTRNPIDLAQVRLLDNRTNRIIQSRVTDTQGRYIFFADPGVYRIEVDKAQYGFPTTLLANEREDGPYLDIYHGEPIRITEENTAIAANIPIDPVTADKPPRRIKLEKLLRRVQTAVAMFGVVAGIVAVIISPTPITVGLLVLQVVVLFLFYRLATPKKPKNWGIVYDKENKKRLPQVVVRLFSRRFDKLVSTDMTDTKGRYAFLANPNEYYVTFNKHGYKEAQHDIVVREDDQVIDTDIGLEKQS